VYVPNVVDRTPPYIEYVEPGSPAQKAGLLPDDLIVYVDGLPVVSVNSLLELMQKYRPQERIQLEIRRGDKLQTISVQVESPPKALPNKGAETKGN
jgi:serine protease Do